MMNGTRISITDAKQRLGELVKRSWYGGERFLLEFHDKPQAALISFADLERLQRLESTTGKRKAALARLRSLRESMPVSTGEEPDSAKEIEDLREERLDDILGMR